MAFWSGEKLKEELAPLITGYDENAIDCAAYTLRIGNEIYISPDHKVEILSQHTKQKLRPGEGFAIPPGQFAFLTTQEKITVPNSAIAFISIRARPKFRGLINISGFHVDPGYKGQLVFSVLNAGPTPHHLEEGQKLFLIWFADLDRQTAMKKEEDEGFTGLDTRLVNDISGEILSLQNLSERQRELELELKSDLSTQREKIGQLDNLFKTMIAFFIALLVSVGVLVLQGFWSSDGPTTAQPASPVSTPQPVQPAPAGASPPSGSP